MTSQQLIEEGRRLQRPCVFLRPAGSGPVAAVWYGRGVREKRPDGHHCWLSVDARCIPGLPESVTGCLNVFTDGKNCEGGAVKITPSWLEQEGTKLYAHPASVLPPIDAVFARGSEAVGEWIHAHGWDRSEPYNRNFGDKAIVDEYERIWQREFPMFLQSNVYAVLGGWHMPMPDDDWHDLLDDQLMVLTLRDSEPWVEAWRTKAGEFRVIQRIT